MTEKASRPAAWRGDPESPGVAAAEPATPTNSADDRVLLLVDTKGNRRQLAEQLARHYHVVEPHEQQLPPEGFDLAVVDGPGLRRWRGLLAEAETREQPTFLPVMLVLPRSDLRKRAGEHADLVDEFIVAPVDRSEFLERAELLLRARRMAREQEAELAHLVNHDRATGLPSQALFSEHLQSAIHHASVLGRAVHIAILRAPLSQVRQSLGQHACDEAARLCSDRLVTLLGDDVRFGRLATEEWAVLLPTGLSAEEVTGLLRRADRVSETPINVETELVHLDVYIGVSAYPADASNAIGLMNAAHGALSRAEEPGEPYFYSRDVQEKALRYLRTEAKLHTALEQQQFELWCQPQFRIADEGVIGAEALVRWRLPSGDLVSPGDFIPVAESSGLIFRIDRWVIEAACQTLAQWQATSGIAHLRIAVNITPQDIADPEFVPWIKGLLEHHGVPPPHLELELTESMFCETNDATLDKLNALKAYGVTVAIDDFGTGYSSLGYLQSLPINVLKIDKTFVEKVPGDATSEGIMEAIVGLARHFDLEIVAEGIETQEQLAYLRALGIETGQGFLVGRPVPQKEFVASFARSAPGRGDGSGPSA